MNRIRVVLCLLFCATVLGAGACSIPREPITGIETSPIHFSDDDRALIRDFYSAFEFPPDLQNPAILAPEIEKRLELSATLPPDIAATPLPLELQEQLSPLAPGYERFRTGQDVILMEIRTRQVVDIVTDIFGTALNN